MKQLRITQRDYYQLKGHLFSGDGLESVALALCGRMKLDEVELFLVNKVVLVPYDESNRTTNSVSWKGEFAEKLLKEAMDQNLAILKIHSHPNGSEQFSAQDDGSDFSFYSSVFGWTQSNESHISAIMLPDGKIIARAVNNDISFSFIDKVSIVGDELKYYFFNDNSPIEVDQNIHKRSIQAFGCSTMSFLKGMSVTVVGCSGTGSPVIEQLVRLGVGEILLVDFDRVEHKNLNRILNTSFSDADEKKLKVDVLAERISWMGLGTKIKTISENICNSRSAIKMIASTDFIFGCSDSMECRDVLNRISTFYLLPYLDLGVVLIADGNGKVSKIAGAAHYIQPKGSSLLSREVYTLEQVAEESMKRKNPDQFEQFKEQGYIRGIANEESPAVISINMFAASIAINEFLNRIHPYKSMDTFQTRAIRFTISDNYIEYDNGGSIDTLLEPLAGMGDRDIFLELIGL